MTRTLAVTGDEFLARAPFTLSATLDLPHRPEQVWAAMTGDQMGSWVRGLDRAAWLTPRGRGAIRTLRIARLITITEEYYHWHEQERMTFRVTQITHPVVSGWAEDMRLEPLPGGGSRLSWTMALDSPLLRVLTVPRFLQPALNAYSQRTIRGILTILPPVA